MSVSSIAEIRARLAKDLGGVKDCNSDATVSRETVSTSAAPTLSGVGRNVLTVWGDEQLLMLRQLRTSGHSYAAMAQALGTTVPAIKSILHRKGWVERYRRRA